jgi:TRAP transporter 4TM/12TM fusion protein
MFQPNSIRNETAKLWQLVYSPTAVIALAWVCFQILFYFEPGIDSLIRRSGHVGFAVALGMSLWADSIENRLFRAALRCASLVSLAPAVFMFMDIERVSSRMTMLDPVLTMDVAMALVAIISLIIVGYRVLGRGITLVAVAFIAYQFGGEYFSGLLRHRETDFLFFLENQYLTLEGVYGVPTGISADVVFYFILFAAVFDTFGGGRMIMDLALSLTGRRKGGPAKCAILSSGLMGSVSGSAVANVMSTGIFTIPLMQRVGYKPRFAAAVESVASTGGQIMPPVMGAGAFIMADFLRIPYSQIVLVAILPAVLFFGALYLVVHLEAGRTNMAHLDDNEVPKLSQALMERGHMLIPLLWLAVLVVSGFGVADATMQAVALTILIGSCRASTRAAPSQVVTALIETAKRAVSVALPCALASIIVSVIAFSGLGTKFTSILIDFAGGSFIIMLVAAMVGSVVLGAGMPTTSAYIMSAVLIAPAIVALGADALSAHLFIYYFAILSMVTPPVALAAYAAATIAKTDPNSTGVKAIWIAAPIFLIPFTFFAHDGILLNGSTVEIVADFIFSLAMIFATAVFVIGWCGKPLSPALRASYAVLAIGVGFSPIFVISAIGLGLIVMLTFVLKRQSAQRGAVSR